ncbi:DUF4224 domain-containing protein [Pseudoxanthomonas winnipegensis]|uniref:DUF4224 domain-containing protein n=1 Tax=Pseudoxanthomonas winnipegensis TaxID=2480810 RepID=A0A4Q8LFN4_9GAMM|nr:DUF4224 domain-containing protein [Pseudoxanthomonas winnipegensis]TAA27849.1 DUF4224 domain-containing protein [Pseudoxanthomonas winnipegensis]TAA42316.1 DUF4224 domain-containing protein [Pseudoxanthomonas winnipegensis]TBV70663.1 DUF4224 domain-containing protein [Pseudoxanthomonas winnipegensis]
MRSAWAARGTRSSARCRSALGRSGAATRLLKNGIRHYIDLHGRPVVTRATIEGTPAPEAVAPGTWKSNKAA